ncbi:hypothetical protein [Paenarthrobacter ureafaciens]|uniref:hypothetical protein n=1 Tax=Paenarthrobacter ureafaciens TaxID=37931 RepID=UPI00140985F4|nr:hypothetical protein [Paenarthrobacter ureafaciens]MCX8454669.1 hypothetical protein [Paenarthrobacter ureafaciens]MCY0974162.1 hypothetical protein [Paenarthrobacter ureafaciens]
MGILDNPVSVPVKAALTEAVAAAEAAVNNKADKTTLQATADPMVCLDQVVLLCDFPVRENGEVSWPQGLSINHAADELYISNQNGTELRIDVRSLSTGIRKSSRVITTEDQCWSEGIPWFLNESGDLCFIVRTTGGTPANSATYAIYNYTTNSVGSPISIKGAIRADVEGDFFVTTDAWSRTVTNFFVYDWASVKAGAPTLLATVPAEGAIATAAKNQGLAYVGGYYFIAQGDQSESPTFQAWDSQGRLVVSKQYSRSSFKALVNKLKPGLLTNDSYTYEAEGTCNHNGKLVSAQIVNNNPAVAAEGRVLILQHNRIDGTRGIMQPVNSFVYDTGWIPLDLINGFTAAPGVVPAVRRRGNMVMFQGQVIKNAQTNYEACATLPVLTPSLWPKVGSSAPPFAQSANSTATMNVRVSATNGNVELYSSAATAAWRGLNGIFYMLD